MFTSHYKCDRCGEPFAYDADGVVVIRLTVSGAEGVTVEWKFCGACGNYHFNQLDPNRRVANQPRDLADRMRNK